MCEGVCVRVCVCGCHSAPVVAKRRMPAHDEFILYGLRGRTVSFCTVSIASASSSRSKEPSVEGAGLDQ